MKRYGKHFAYIATLVVVVIILGVPAVFSQEASSEKCTSSEAFCFTPQLDTTTSRLDAVTLPKIATPAWLSAQGGSSQSSSAREVAYQVAPKGNVTADIDEFRSQVSQTLNSPSGWSRLGVRFVEVDSGGQFTVWLSEASQVPSFSPSGCDAIVSCRVGNNVIINETRWQNGSDAWNAAGGSLSGYRQMVINHETGHWLGHGHEQCSGAGQPAAVMQQQTLDMQGCTPNSWPLGHELYAPTIGIRS